MDISPPVHRSMTSVLNRELFRKSITVVGLQVPAHKVTAYRDSDLVKKSLLRIPKIKSVWPISGSPDKKLLLLHAEHDTELPSQLQEYLLQEGISTRRQELRLDYSYWTANEILSAILPEDVVDGSPTGFTLTGHIAHLNLNDEYLPYKHVIGQVILDKNSSVRTVVNKLDNINTQFRFFEMELLAGENNYLVEAHESNCRFRFDFSKVYWNSRLHKEHDRIVGRFNAGDVVADCFAGVGPFAIPAAKKGCSILANDLNPASAEYLRENVQLNSVGDRIRVSQDDGRNFIRTSFRGLWDNPFPPFDPQILLSQSARRKLASRGQKAGQWSDVNAHDYTPKASRREITHFVMNLPDSAITFLDAFRGCLNWLPDQKAYTGMPWVFCHCFTRELESPQAEIDIRERVQEHLGYAFGLEDAFSVQWVRSVAPNKEMYCAEFRLPASIAFWPM